MGGAQPLAITMNEGVALIAEVDERRIQQPAGHRLPGQPGRPNLDEALAKALEARDAGRPLSVAVLANAADVTAELLRRGIIPDIVTDQTPAHDPLMYVPQGMSVAQAEEMRRDRPGSLPGAWPTGRWASTSGPWWSTSGRGAVVFDYGNNLRQRGKEAGVEDAFSYPGFVPAFIRPLFCRGKGPFRWVALSGDPEDIYRTDEAMLRLFPENDQPCPVDEAGPREDPLPGAAGPHLLARLRRAGQGGAGVQPDGARGRAEGADSHRPRPPGLRLGGLSLPGDGVRCGTAPMRSRTGRS